MKRFISWTAVLGLSCLVTGLHAESKKITYFGEVEYLTYSDAFEEKENTFNEWGWNIKTSGGAGVRAGILKTTLVKGLQMGGSLGYILGPSFEGNRSDVVESLDVEGHVVGYVEIKSKVKDESNIWRLMAESKYSVPLGDRFQARLGFGIGVAMLHIEENISNELVGGPSFGSENHSLNTTKITWEIGPGIAYVSGNIGIELALTYSQMPTAINNMTFQEFDWNPLGIRLGVEF